VLKVRVVLQSTEARVLVAALAVTFSTWIGCGDSNSDPKCQPAAEVGATSSCGPGGAGGSGGSGMPVVVNGCDSSMAIDKTSDATTMISFAGIEYTPRCVRVRSGSMVVFSGNFVTHPLVGGTVSGSTATPDSASPVPATSSGSEVTITLSKAGSVPYYCTAHASSGMTGAIFVE
jgi:plastocyanin